MLLINQADSAFMYRKQGEEICPTSHLGGVTEPFCYFPLFSITHWIPRSYWQASPQLSCGSSNQVWMRFNSTVTLKNRKFLRRKTDYRTQIATPLGCEAYPTRFHGQYPDWGRLNIKMSYQYGDPNVKDKTISRQFYLYHGNPHTWERRSLYWDGALVGD